MKIPFAGEALAGVLIATHAMTALSSDNILHPHVEFADAAASRISIGQAILIAEQHTGGSAVEAELDRMHDRLVYDIDVETSHGDVEVMVDTVTGAVLSAETDD